MNDQASRLVILFKNRNREHLLGQTMEPTDHILVGQVLDGDLSAWNKLVSRWERGIYNFVYRIVGHEEDARDLVQETMIRVFQGLNHLKDPAKFPSWIYRIAHNVCLDRLRSGKNRSMISRDALVENGMEGVLNERIDRFQSRPHPDEALYQLELSEILAQALQTLSEEQRTALVMREYNGYASREIAEILGIPVGTVRSRIFHGLRNLERVLKRLRAEEER